MMINKAIKLYNVNCFDVLGVSNIGKHIDIQC